jgi:hypothetical protein
MRVADYLANFPKCGVYEQAIAVDYAQRGQVFGQIIFSKKTSGANLLPRQTSAHFLSKSQTS